MTLPSLNVHCLPLPENPLNPTTSLLGKRSNTLARFLSLSLSLSLYSESLTQGPTNSILLLTTLAVKGGDEGRDEKTRNIALIILMSSKYESQ